MFLDRHSLRYYRLVKVYRTTGHFTNRYNGRRYDLLKRWI